MLVTVVIWALYSVLLKRRPARDSAARASVRRCPSSARSFRPRSIFGPEPASASLITERPQALAWCPISGRRPERARLLALGPGGRRCRPRGGLAVLPSHAALRRHHGLGPSRRDPLASFNGSAPGFVLLGSGLIAVPAGRRRPLRPSPRQPVLLDERFARASRRPLYFEDRGSGRSRTRSRVAGLETQARPYQIGRG